MDKWRDYRQIEMRNINTHLKIELSFQFGWELGRRVMDISYENDNDDDKS